MVEGRDGASFRDPSGFVFWRDGVVYRQVSAGYRSQYDALMGSGLYAELVAAGLLVPHDEVPPSSVGAVGADLVLRPERIAFTSYPYEWCFGQLRDAARATLDIARRALDRDLVLKDASAFNIQFAGARPLLIDTLSFERYAEGAPWVAYRQFCQHFLAPLLLMALRDVRLGGLLRHHLDGIPLDLASALLPRRTWLRPGPLLHLHLHAKSQQRFADTPLRDLRGPRSVSRTGLRGVLDSLEGAVRRLDWRPTGTVWADYVREHSYDERAWQDKQHWVRELVAEVRPGLVWDLGANVGLFSRLAAEGGACVVAVDADAGAVERHYRDGRERGERNVLPLWIDLTNPSPALGWAHRERRSFLDRGPADLVLALALIHHLAISNNVPLPDLARFLASAGRHLIVEFVPKDDRQAQRLLGSRADVFPDYTPGGFEQAFSEVYAIERSVALADSGRRLYLMRRR
jgi:hypothetical protein